MKKFLLICISFIVLHGCASFPQNEMVPVGAMPDVSNYKNKPSVYIDFRFYRGKPGYNAREIGAVKAKLSDKIRSYVNESNLFSTVTLDEFDRDKADYTIKLYGYNHGDEAAAMISGFLTGYSLGIIPGVATDNYTLRVELLDKSGQSLKRIENKDSVNTWIGIWFIPAMANTPEEAVETTLENQIKTALKQLIESGQLKYSKNESIEILNLYNA